MKQSNIQYWVEGVSCVNEKWENAYNAFETKDEEVKKFIRRFKKGNLHSWDKEVKILDLFCGKGSGLEALKKLGFNNLLGVDLSPELLQKCKVDAQLFVGDCRNIELPDGIIDVVTIQGGLHHLPKIKDDLPKTLDEISRVLSNKGKLFIVEPWSTKLLSILHILYKSKFIRSLWPKFDALATMTHLEYPVYDIWLDNKEFVLDELTKRFEIELLKEQYAKILFVGKKRR